MVYCKECNDLRSVSQTEEYFALCFRRRQNTGFVDCSKTPPFCPSLFAYLPSNAATRGRFSEGGDDPTVPPDRRDCKSSGKEVPIE
jgi:hypothetical protein